MPGGWRDARRTDRYLDDVLEAGERRSPEVPADLDLDPAVVTAARRLRSDLVRVHPSFRFEEALAARLGRTAEAIKAGRPVTADGFEPWTSAPVVQFDAARRSNVESAPGSRRHGVPARAQKPLVMGGVGVASAALSIGAVYVAWRWSRASRPPMVRAARAAHSGRTRPSSAGRRAGVLHGILGVMS
jgi:hypothetical protein